MKLSEDDLRHKYSEEVAELNRQIREKNSYLESYKKNHGQLAVFFSQVKSVISPISPLPKREIKSKAPGRDKPIVPVMQITDSHIGEIQEAYEIEGFNEYNPEVAERRCMAYSERFLHWAMLHRNSYNVRECKILITGDLISGDIHDELKITNAYPITQQVVESAKIHSKQIAILAPYFNLITVEFITDDNHSRITKKPQQKEGGTNSMNYLVATLMESFLKSHKNIQFNIHAMNEKVVNVNGRKYLIAHGHGIKSWMSVPWYGIERKVGKESQARMQLIMQDVERAKEIGFDKYIHGHFHVCFDSPLYSCGGSVSGTSAYDHSCGRYAPPSQSSWMVHPKYGEFDRINFNLSYY